MWPRTVELMLGFWLAASPFVFAHDPGDRLFWWTDLGAALLLVSFSLLSFSRRMRRAHLASLAVALWLVGAGALGPGEPPPPAAQNELIVGLLVLMLAILPTEATLPPLGWRS